MPRVTLPILALLGCFACPASVATAQAFCRRADSVSARLIHDVVMYTSATDPIRDAVEMAMRDSLGLPAGLRPDQIALVADESICKKAADAFAAAVAAPADRRSGRVYVVRADQTYVVFDPAYYDGDRPELNWTRVVFDSQWRVLSMD